MRLLVTTPLAIVVDEADVASVRAEDDSGSFGILEHHADFLTSLTICVVIWRNHAGAERYCAVRRGLLTVSGGREVAVVTREAHPGDDLEVLERDVLSAMRATIDEERVARAESLRLQMKAVREIIHRLGPGQIPGEW